MFAPQGFLVQTLVYSISYICMVVRILIIFVTPGCSNIYFPLLHIDTNNKIIHKYWLTSPRETKCYYSQILTHLSTLLSILISGCGSKRPFRSLQHHLSRHHKHCQRHNGPEDWVHLTKVTSWGHITNSNTNLDQISSSESRPSINFKISSKHQHLD